MTLYERYINGHTEQVYQDIYALGQDAFLPGNLPNIEKVLTETFQRAAHNLDGIYAEQENINYVFPTEFKYNFQRPLIKPLQEVEPLVAKLDMSIEPFGFVPLSLKMFYKVLGACNFAWGYETNEEYMWQLADPIQIFSVEDVVLEITDEGFANDLQEQYEKDGFVSIQLSADYFHKDNTGGGPAYSLKVTNQPSVDAAFLNEEHNTTFINYLRICFDNCGFSRITNPENHNDYEAFFEKVNPQVKPI